MDTKHYILATGDCAVFKDYEIKKVFEITKFHTAFERKCPKGYSFAGEMHDFWEFVYVDKGEIIATAGDEDFLLGHGKIIFHKPNEWHTLRANGSIAPNIVIASFACSSPAMGFFENKIMKNY